MRGFKVGDRVESPYGAQGRVTKIDDAIHVTYKDRGKEWHGIYDERWFEIYGDQMLKNWDAQARTS